jgi:CheY-like chemotaxis protein
MTHTVLYVEDNEDNIMLVERILRRRPEVGLEVAKTGAEGLRLAQDTAPDLILLDRRLPDMLGPEVLRQLKQAPDTSAIPVVVLSGDSAADHADEVLDLGASEFLPKPFELSQFLAMIDRFCA